MHFDALTVACVATELQRTIEGGRVQQLVAVDEQSMGLELYAQRQRHYLLLSADPKTSRVHLVSEKLRRGVEKESPLLLLLRKYVRGSQLTAVEQPDVTERLLQLHFSHPTQGQTRLVVELIGQRSNLILVNDAGRILDSLRRVWDGEGVQRPLMPKQPYAPPPAQEKCLPFVDPPATSGHSGITRAQLAEMLQAEGPLWRLLVNQFAGVSPTVAREIAWRATGQIDAMASQADADAVAMAMQALWALVDTAAWQPGYWLVDGEQDNQRVAGFAAYVVHGRGDFVPTASLQAALTAYYTETQQTGTERTPSDARADEPQQDGYAALRGTVAKALEQALARLQRQLDALASDEPAPGEPEKLRTQAEWLLALQSQIQPEQRVLEVPLDEQLLSIPLMAEKTPVEQAEQMFDRAAKLERAAQIIPKRRAKLRSDRAYLEQLQLDLEAAANQPEIAAIQQELETMGLLSGRGRLSQRRAKKGGGQVDSQPLRYHAPEGFEIVVGRNARQNELVTFRIANAEDLWLHARGAPGAHVVIRSGGQPVSEETLQLAAQLAAYHSKLVGELAATVIVTPRRFIGRAPGGRPGQVLVRQEETLTVPGRLPAAFAA